MNITIKFEKYTGAGNDFVIIEDLANRCSDDFYQNLTPICCDRHFGIGGDGVMVIRKSDTCDFKMMYWNPDGSIAGMCGNGGRCIAMMYYRYFKKENLTFETRSGMYSAKILSDEVVELSMIDPYDFEKTPYLAEHSAYINTGTQHLVLPIQHIDQINVVEQGKLHRNSPFALNKGGANINFIEKQNASTIKIRTYEKGVEDETLACGTGTVAAAIVAFKNQLIDQKPVQVIVRSGEKLVVNFDNQYKNVTLTGQAKFLFSGEVTVDDKK